MALQDPDRLAVLDITAVDGNLPMKMTGPVVDLAASAHTLMLSGCMFSAEVFNQAHEWKVRTLVLNEHRSTANLEVFGCFSSITRLELKGVVGTPTEGANSLQRALAGMQDLRELDIFDRGVVGLECKDVCQAVQSRRGLRLAHVVLGRADRYTRHECWQIMAGLCLYDGHVKFEKESLCDAEE